MTEHRLLGNSVVREAFGIVGRCVCGWSTGPRFTSMVASSLFQDHLDNPDAPEPPPMMTLPPQDDDDSTFTPPPKGPR